ncbi:hypothetical protein GCM10029963_11460 [Micromonospora andamanensis]|uniref:hypothetical protein n=1 Tax=Micromonospora andamanensis TaxID=1287068 RepID=UPI00194FCAD9|nr:hypothetical protein [Micromonospora andamanensis]GIJ39117.1 hypothetical protein Vwe01_24420 [Micromonospora andamanensis]
MVREQPYSDLIRAMARADWDTAEALCDEIRRSGQAGTPYVIGAAFALAVNRYFAPDATPTDVAAWVSTVRARYQDGDTPPALETEGLIRAALGEPELVDSMPAETVLDAEIFVLVHILLDRNLTDAELDEFLAEAEEVAAEYQ